MATGKGNTGKKPKVAGLDEIDVATSQTDMPHAYFAGIAKLNVDWIMQPVNVFTKPTPSGTKK